MPVLARTTAYAACPDGAPALSHPRPERLLAGNPLRETWNQVDAPLAGAQRLSSGIWRCEPGHWRIAFGPAQQEVFTVLAGRCRVHDAQGGFQALGPGDVLHIPPGFEGSFEVLETMTKSYVITE
ncbi:MAG: cupin domain-containing protein [Burkholderiaceae bacterium]|nr:cupin domain-containing protein [Burkholderiaceae bacterium]